MTDQTVSLETTDPDSPDPGWARNTAYPTERYSLFFGVDAPFVSVFPGRGLAAGQWIWEWHYMYARQEAGVMATGQANTKDAAMIAAQSFEPERLYLEYAGHFIEWLGCPQRDSRTQWSACIGGSLAIVQDAATYFPETPWAWTRGIPEADQALLEIARIFSCREYSGRSKTQAQAMTEAASAPARLRLAAAVAGAYLAPNCGA